MLRCLLNGIAIEEPSGLKELAERVYFSTELSGYLQEVVGSIEIKGSGYNILRELLEEDICSEVEITVQKNQQSLFTGKIFLIDVVWSLVDRIATCEIAHSGFMSRIDHNKQIKCYTNVPKSKNGEAIFANPIVNFRIPDVDNVPANDNLFRRGVYVFDAFKTIIEFMTDGAVSFVSDYFDYNVATPTRASLQALITGKSLRDTAFSTFPYLSFKELYDDMNALHNLAFTFEGDNVIRIEPKGYFTAGASTDGELLEGVKDVRQSLDRESFPAKMVFGSAKTVNDYNYLPDLRFLGMNEEEYHLGGQCNLDTELNVATTTIITDPNIIQDIVPTGTYTDRDYDEDVFLVCMDPNDPNRAEMTPNPANTAEFYLNDFVTNEKVALRWFGNVPISIYAFLGSGNNGCFIGLGSTQNAINVPRVFFGDLESPLPYNDLNNNYGTPPTIRSFPSTWAALGNWTPLLTPQLGGYYVAPFSAVYSFEVDLFFEFSTWFRLYAVVMNPPALGGGFVQAILLSHNNVLDDPNLLAPNPYHVTAGSTVYMEATQYIGIAVSHPTNYLPGSTFQMFDPLGDRWASFYQEDVFTLKSQMNYGISEETWQNTSQNPYRKLRYTINDGKLRGGPFREITRNIVTGDSQIVINEKG